MTQQKTTRRNVPLVLIGSLVMFVSGGLALAWDDIMGTALFFFASGAAFGLWFRDREDHA